LLYLLACLSVSLVSINLDGRRNVTIELLKAWSSVVVQGLDVALKTGNFFMVVFNTIE
jgi:hypothetical protein